MNEPSATVTTVTHETSSTPAARTAKYVCSLVACGGAHTIAVIRQQVQLERVHAGEAGGGERYGECEVWVWGSDTYGEAGLRQKTVQHLQQLAPGAISPHDSHAPPASVDGRRRAARAVPREGRGKVGRGQAAVLFHVLPQHLSSLQSAASSISELHCGSSHTLVLLTSARLFAFGRGDYGQQGNGELEDVPTPTPVPLFDHHCPHTHVPLAHCAEGDGGGGGQGGSVVMAEAVAAGAEHCFVRDTRGQLWAWGRNDYGQLGPVVSAGDELVVAPQLVVLPKPVVKVV